MTTSGRKGCVLPRHAAIRHLCRLVLGLALLTAPPCDPAQAQTRKPAKDATTTPQAEPAAPPIEKEAPYDKRLLRFAEVVGAVDYLRTLCKTEDGGNWRSAFQTLIDADAGAEPQRKARLTAAFNRGYRSFAAVHRSCTPAASLAEQRYRAEGATLATEITARFGN